MAELGDGAGSSYPTSLDTDASMEIDGVAGTLVRAAVPNDLAAAIIKIETEMGTDPAGSLADVKTRLAVALNDNGTVKNDAITGVMTTELLYDVHRQNNITDTSVTDQTVRKGWGFILGVEAVYTTESVSFGVTYDDIPIVVASCIGYKDNSDPANAGDAGISAIILMSPCVITTTGFTLVIATTDGSNLLTARRYLYSWIADGSKAK